MVTPARILDASRVVRVVAIGLALLLSSCVTSNGVRVGWSSSLHSTEYSASYASWNGSASVPINIRESSVVFSYQAEVKKGSLSIALHDPQGQDVWRTTLNGSGSGSRILSTPRTGSYSLVVEGQNTAGNFDIRWS